MLGVMVFNRDEGREGERETERCGGKEGRERESYCQYVPVAITADRGHTGHWKMSDKHHNANGVRYFSPAISALRLVLPEMVLFTLSNTIKVKGFSLIYCTMLTLFGIH